jgi:hypothetical protein
MAQLAQDTAQYKIDNALLNNAKAAKLAKMRKTSDDASIPSLSAMLQEVHNATICLMRLSKPLLSNHLNHQTTIRHCEKDDKHHVNDLQRLLPHATLTVLKRLSKSICARRLELLRMNSQRGGLRPVSEDVTFLRMLLLDLASVSDEAIKYESSARSSVLADAGRLGAEPSSFEYTENVESSLAERSKANIRQTESLPISSEYMPKSLEPIQISTAQRREDSDYKTKLQTGQKARQALFGDQESSNPEMFTVTACTRCRVVRLTRTRDRDYHVLTSLSSVRRGAILVCLSVDHAREQVRLASTTIHEKAEY